MFGRATVGGSSAAQTGQEVDVKHRCGLAAQNHQKQPPKLQQNVKQQLLSITRYIADLVQLTPDSRHACRQCKHHLSFHKAPGQVRIQQQCEDKERSNSHHCNSLSLKLLQCCSAT